IAAVTAFLVVNAGNLGLPSSSLVVWLGPSLMGVPAIAIWTGYYRRRFARLEPRRIRHEGFGHEGHEAHEVFRHEGHEDHEGFGHEGHDAHEGMGRLQPAATNPGA